LLKLTGEKIKSSFHIDFDVLDFDSFAEIHLALFGWGYFDILHIRV
jgi:hypothetical protein